MGVAVALWSISFLFGLRYLEERQGLLTANMDLVEIQEGSRPAEFPEVSQEQAVELARGAIRRINDRGSKKYLWQQRCLFVGALFYIAAHVMQMAVR